METKHLTQLTDAELITEVHALTARERSATVALIAAIAEIDLRRLYLGLGYSSMFAFCTARLHLSERAAYSRITAGRAAQRFPIVLTLLEDGSITLTTVMVLAAHLTAANHVDVLTAAIHRSKREVERQVAALFPQPAAEVWARDGCRCTFVGTDGRCSARRLLELHHVVPYANGGATDATNLTLRCRAHNQYDADLHFGPWTVREAPVTYAGGLRTPSGSS